MTMLRSPYHPVAFPKIRNLLDVHASEEYRLSDQIVAVLRDLRDLAKWDGLDWTDLLMASTKIESTDAYGPEEFVHGTVQMFAKAEGKKFGFMVDGAFFHMDRGIVLGCDGGDVAVEMAKEIKEPLPGAKVVYMRAQTKKGFAASWWAYEWTLQQAQEDIERRPLYRFSSRIGTKLWEGKDIAKWRLQYPLSWHKSDPRYDVVFYTIQKYEDGAWVPASDPR